MLTVLHEGRFQDRSPAAVQATLLDEGQYLCSTRTMYRILERQEESRARRDQLVHPAYRKPELLATAPNQLWSWDITKLLGPAKWTYFYLYVILDVFSRYVVGWMLAPRETAELAKRLIGETCRKFEIPEGQLTIHADRGSSMRSKPVAFLQADLGVTKTHSRPHVSDDNPYSESQFRTMKYRPDSRTASAASKTAVPFASSSLVVQPGAPTLRHRFADPGHGSLRGRSGRSARRQVVLDAAYQAHPDRFVRRPPKPLPLPSAVWINKPAPPRQKADEGSQLIPIPGVSKLLTRAGPRAGGKLSRMRSSRAIARCCG